MASLTERARSVLQRRGVAGAARSAFERALKQREFLWYGLELAVVEARPLPEPYRLDEIGAERLDVLAEIGSIPVEEARDWIEAHGGRLFMVFDDHEDPAFSCFILPVSQPLDPAPEGCLRFPEGMACLERSFTAPGHRGRGVAAAAWTQIFDRLAGGGDRVVVTKVEVSNRASRRAVSKAGFAEVGSMRIRGAEPGSRLKSIKLQLPPELAHEQPLFDRLAANLRG